VNPHWQTGRAGLLTDPEDRRALVVEQSLLDKVIDRAARNEVGIELDKWCRPETLIGVFAIHKLLDVACSEFGERAGKSLIIFYQAVSELEYVHHVPQKFLNGSSAEKSIGAFLNDKS
jgi:hypothetical protein